ncbi:hypothetical protein ACFQJD_15555 [Haloplanus sp. GCM10025708]|uniref:hypothetical protein n=1 Tax=Haloplanus sp. GCM10025708 TaxID=3252679 RepID=UPI00361C94DF
MTNDNRTVLATLLSAVLVVSAVVGAVGAFSGSVAATESSTISANPQEAGVTSTHTVEMQVESNDDSSSLNEIEVDYSVSSSPADVTNVGTGDVVEAYIDRGNTGSKDVSVLDDLSSASASNNGETIAFSFGGSYTIQQEDRVVIVYGDVQNPGSSGQYSVDVAINTQSTDNPSTATLDITAGAPSISEFQATDAGSLDVQVSFHSDEQLSSISVDLSGAESTTLTEADFTNTSSNGGYEYTATYAGSTEGTYTATLNTATDADGNDGASGQSDDVYVSNVQLSLVDGSASPPRCPRARRETTRS